MSHAIHTHESCKHVAVRVLHSSAFIIAMQQISSEQPDPVVQQDTLVYADIGPSSFKNRGKQIVTLSSDDMDDRVEYALLNHSLQKPTNQDSMAGKVIIIFCACNCLK